MKKILLLGGSGQQVIAIQTAKKLGYYTVLCDYLPDNPGKDVADIFYQVSTTDKDEVLSVARKEKIEGIVAYSSDPAAPTAAYVSEQMGLPGIPYQIAESFCEKHLFRKFLETNGFNTPKSVALKKDSDATIIKKLHFPIIIKPTDSSGSKGVSVVESFEQVEPAIEAAIKIGRNGIIIAEEYIVRDHRDVIEAEIFVVDGTVKIWGLMNTIRDERTNPLVPAAYSYPLNISESRKLLVKEEVQRLITATGVKYGAFNIEIVITKEEKLYFLDAGPRNGGNMLPEFIGLIANNDLVEATINASMGHYENLKNLKLDGESGGYWGMSVLHTDKSGMLNRITYNSIAKLALIRQADFKEVGQQVEPFTQSRAAIGLSFFKFNSKSDRDAVLYDNVGKYIVIDVEETQNK